MLSIKFLPKKAPMLCDQFVPKKAPIYSAPHARAPVFNT